MSSFFSQKKNIFIESNFSFQAFRMCGFREKIFSTRHLILLTFLSIACVLFVIGFSNGRKMVLANKPLKAIYNNSGVTSFTTMGVRRFFSRGGQKFSRWEREPTFCLKKQRKRYYFSPKKV
jgi:hypothetical protein